MKGLKLLKEYGNTNFNMDPNEKKAMVIALAICAASTIVEKAIDLGYSLKCKFHSGDKLADIELSPPDSPVE